MDKKGVIITAIEEIDTPNEVFNLHVEDNHNYFAEDIIVSNCHQFKAKSLVRIMGCLVNAEYRIGTTGTLDDSKINGMVLEGLFGPVMNVASTKDLIQQKTLADFKINCMVLKHSEEVCKLARKFTYVEEIDYLVGNEKRNRFIRNLALSLDGNTLVLYQYVEKHGKILHELIDTKTENRKVFFISGDVDVTIRESIRKIVETETNAIIVASYGVFSVGVNLKNLHNIIFASPSKSRVRTLQSIGRSLRVSETKTKATLYDIADDMRHKKHENYTLKHFLVRIAIYAGEKFPFRLFKIDLNI